jgi:small subunit ribosomal protein S8
MQLDIISNLFSALQNAELSRKKECLISPTSRLMGNVLRLLQKEGYLGEFEFIDDGRGGKFRIQLLGRINRCGPIKPRFPVGASEFVDWAKIYLPAKDIGVIIASTPKGVMTHSQCVEENTGGVLLGYVY